MENKTNSRLISKKEKTQVLKKLDLYSISKIDNFLSRVSIEIFLGLVNSKYNEINKPQKVIYPEAPTRNTSFKTIYNL